MDGSGNITQTNTWGAAGLVMRHSATTANYYTWDDRGNAVQRLNSTGGVVQSYLIGGHNAEAGSPASTDPYSGYGGQYGYYRDSESNGILCTYRFYDPEEGRWLNRDPIGYEGGINLYGYVANNPTNLIDPDGLNPYRDWFVRNAPNIARGASAAGRYAGQILNPRNWSVKAGNERIANTGRGAWNWGKGLFKKPCREYKYHPRIRERAVQDPKHHNFPYSFDEVILSTAPIRQTDGSLLYRVPGYVNKIPGVYEIAVNPTTRIIFHRTFNASKNLKTK
jgi:RHS repeat-associated protein